MSAGYWALIAIYLAGVVIAMMISVLTSAFGDLPRWYERPLILIWPLTLACVALWHAALFLVGKE